MSAVASPSRAGRLAPAIADAIAQEMRADPRVVVWGEDVRISVMGPTRGLAAEFADRVWDTPISEAAFVGAAVGAAVGGLRPIVDLMFSSFAYVCFDQLVNQAGRLRYMSGGRVSVPLVVIGSAGAADSNAAQHSEVPSALLLNGGGLRVVFPSTPHQAFWLTRAAIRSDDPVVILHHPALAGSRGTIGPTAIGLGDAEVGPPGTDLTILASGLMASRARAAAGALGSAGISAEVVDVCSLSPMPWDTILSSVKKTGRALIVDEARISCSVASEIAAGIAEHAFSALRAPITRLAVPDVPIPFAPNLEDFVVPSQASIVSAATELVKRGAGDHG
ncbi:MAG TPA: transketolase C-terminal domain-containing protein [Candidatus Sulfotelmatobacter sp.]|nr:transketolase C-terminal domain-containing protein [Candidatus Sulfotelmatobacter sp.]